MGNGNFLEPAAWTAQLKEINRNLDDLVRKRTEDMEESRGKIEQQKLELEKANQTLYLLSLKDPLTGLWNRRHYDDTIQIEWNRSLRHKRPISLLMLDIDHFKAFNDYYGHRAGDECLVKVARAINDSFKRDGDLVARYGGEEFIVIMADMEKDGAVRMVNLLRKTIEDLNIPHECLPVSSRVTASIGVTAEIPAMNRTPQNLFLACDKALYEAKAAGRNQVRFYTNC